MRHEASMRRWAAIAIGVAMSACLILGAANAQVMPSVPHGVCRSVECGAPTPPAPPPPPTPPYKGGGTGRCTGQRAQNCASCMQKCAFDPTRAFGSCNKGECDINSPNYSPSTRNEIYRNCLTWCSPNSDLLGPPKYDPVIPSQPPTSHKDCICPNSPNPSTSHSSFQGGKPAG